MAESENPKVVNAELNEIQLKEKEDARVAAEEIKAEKEKQKLERQQRRAQFFANLKQGVKTTGQYSGAVASDMYQGAQNVGVATNQGLFIILSMLLFVSDWVFTKFNGIDFVTFLNSLPTIWLIVRGGLFTAILITLAIIYIMKRPDSREFGSWVVLIVVLYMCFALTSFSTGAIVHLLFAILLMLIYISPLIEDKASANYTMALMIFIDFFGFSFFAWLGQITNIPALGTLKNRLLFPFWTLFLLVYPPGLKKSGFVKFLTIGFVIFYIFLFVVPNFSYARLSSSLTNEDIMGVKEGWNVFKTNVKNSAISVYTRGEKGTQNIIEQATGPYYTGVVDENENRPLGVYIKDVKATYPYFYYDDKVILAGTVNVNTLGEPVRVSMGCFVKDKTGKNINGTVSPDYQPSTPVNFDIAESESVPIECTFAPGSFDTGSYRATISADFNFVAYAYMQKYFIDESTARNLPIDTLLKGYDKNPTSHSTGGPVMITMAYSKDSPIIPVKQYENTKYLVGFDLQNSWQNQQGVIKDLNDIILLIPDSMELKKEGDTYDCSHTFVDATVSDCSDGCEDSQICNEVCTTAFTGHKGYKLDRAVLDAEERLKGIKDVRTFSCEAEISLTNRAQVIGDTVPNVMEFRVIAKYDYSATLQSLPFEIKIRPGFNVFIEPTDATSSDILVCKGIHTDASIQSASYQFFMVEGTTETPITELKQAMCDSVKKFCKGEIPKQTKGTIITCKMTATVAGIVEPQEGSKTIKIRNSPPRIIKEPYFDPKTPVAGQELACNVTVADADGDLVKITYTIEGKDSGDTIIAYKNPTNEAECPNYFCRITIPAEEVKAKRYFKCKVAPTDSTTEGNAWGPTMYASVYVPTPPISPSTTIVP
jgi:hypothetical protein